MNQSQEIKDLCEALSKAQGEFKVAHKSKANPFFKSTYADLEAVVDACRPSLTKHGLSFIQMTKPLDGLLVLVTRIMHSSGQWIEGEYPVKIQKDDPQGYGAAVTYSRRYALAAALGVVSSDEDDDAEAAVEHKPEDKAAIIENLTKFFSGKGVSSPRICTKLGVKSIYDLTEANIATLREFASQIKEGIPAAEIFPVPNLAKK